MTRTLLDKLGYKVGMSGWAYNRPPALEVLSALPDHSSAPSPDLIMAFVFRSADVAPVLAAVMPLYTKGARLWLAYPKTSGSIPTDMTRDRGWEALADHDLLGVAQVAIDGDWSALRFRYRSEISRITRRT